jgi:hypothetical protein
LENEPLCILVRHIKQEALASKSSEKYSEQLRAKYGCSQQAVEYIRKNDKLMRVERERKDTGSVPRIVAGRPGQR